MELTARLFYEMDECGKDLALGMAEGEAGTQFCLRETHED